MQDTETGQALAPADFIDSDHPAIIAKAQSHAAAAASTRELAIRLYMSVHMPGWQNAQSLP